jgi:hypothetical protein
MDYFSQILPLVKSGLTIRQAIKKIKVSPTSFYRSITPQQKRELGYIKAMGKHTAVRGTPYSYLRKCDTANYSIDD